MDHNLITGICEGLIENGQASSMSIREVRERVANSLRINAITDFELSNITMRKNRNREATITIAYERRVALFGNLDMIAKFDTVLD